MTVLSSGALGRSWGWSLEAGGWRLEAGGWRLEAGGCRLEAGGWRLDGERRVEPRDSARNLRMGRGGRKEAGEGFRNALRVYPAVTRLTVYRRLHILIRYGTFSSEKSIQWVSAEVVVQTRMLREFMGALLSHTKLLKMTRFHSF